MGEQLGMAWVSIPLVYTQLVQLVIILYFACNLFGNQVIMIFFFNWRMLVFAVFASNAICFGGKWNLHAGAIQDSWINKSCWLRRPHHWFLRSCLFYPQVHLLLGLASCGSNSDQPTWRRWRWLWHQLHHQQECSAQLYNGWGPRWGRPQQRHNRGSLQGRASILPSLHHQL